MAKTPQTIDHETREIAPRSEQPAPAEGVVELVKKTRHRATYATDKKKGGYLVRVAGPESNAFAGRAVPVIMKSGKEQRETLERLIWSGKDKESGEPCSLYSFVAKPKEDHEAEF